ncbi:MAG: D-alanyl-D-alanine carboxypeptidase/D-alanyl-D-alanine-endopeptidase, partial [Syntrophorhabdus sp.]
MTGLKSHLSFAILAFSFLTAISGTAYCGDTSAARLLVNDLQKIVKTSQLKSADFGVTITSLADGHFLFQHNAGKRLIPASNMKIVTTAAALIALTPDFRYSTALKTNGAIRSGILTGDLMIEGSGDPTISGYFNDNDPIYVFREWTKKLKDMGIREVRGDLIIDNSVFSGTPYGEGWNLTDALSCFCAPRDGFMFNNNCIQLDIITAGTLGEKVKTVMEPVTAYVR